MPLAGKPEKSLEARPPVKVNYWINSFDWRSIEIDRLIAATKEAAAARRQLQDRRRRQDLKAVKALKLEVKAAWQGKTLKEAAALRPARQDQEAINRRLLMQTEKRFIKAINRRQDPPRTPCKPARGGGNRGMAARCRHQKRGLD